MHFAEFGVVLMLFLIGLELDPKALWTMRRSVFGGGGLQLASCAVPIFISLLILGLPWQAALVAGLALGLSSTAVCMQTMAERNILKTDVGQKSFSVLLFQDIAAIPLLAVVPLLGQHDTHQESSGVLSLLIALSVVVIVVVVGRYLARPILRVVASTGQREVFTAFTLLLVLGVAQLMALVGISMALGAFLAGVLLASSEYRHALETDIEPFKGLLMGLFFIAVGMSIDFSLLQREFLTILGLVFGYQLIKGLMLSLIAPAIGVDIRSRWLFSALLVQGGEFAFVVFGLARTGGVLPGEWDALLTLAVALSMALTPLLLTLERYIMRPAEQSQESDIIDNEGHKVIIAGFGRFGQIIGRLLFASGHKATVLDHSPEQIETLRRFNFKVYYGDATRLDLLEAAGAQEATVLVNAIDDPEINIHLVDIVKQHFPHIKIISRARNVSHMYELTKRGVDVVERETFESALLLGRKTLEQLGVKPYEARERADIFRRHNISSLRAIFPHWDDIQRRRQMALSARTQLEEQIESDIQKLDSQHITPDWLEKSKPSNGLVEKETSASAGLI